jgi:mRNA interferase RelE/StbE
MGQYAVRADRRIAKSTGKFPPKLIAQIRSALDRLCDTPRPHDSQKLSRGYRVTVGEYRILYTVDDEAKVVTVYKIVKRNDFSYGD